MDKTVIVAIAFVVASVSGCASVPMEDQKVSDAAKNFDPPSGDNAGLYVYRSGSFGSASKKDVLIDGECIGETAPNVFFYHEVPGDRRIEVSTESEFSPNLLVVEAESGVNYFVRQFIKIGVFVAGAGLILVDEEEGKEEVRKLEMAEKGTCSE